MGFRPALDLEDFIDAYEPWLHGRSKKNIDQGTYGSARESTIVLGHTINPLLVGNGPETCSTVTELMLHPTIIWDVNSYYGLLGVKNYRATKKELREFFTEINGHSSPMITNAFKQLINPEIRREYDATPLGQRYMNDPYIQEEIKQAAQKEANKRQKDGQDVSAKDVLNEQGFDVEDEEPVEGPEEVSETEEIPDEPEDEFEGFEEGWDYAYYLWKSIAIIEKPLALWQRAVHANLVKEGAILHFGVGWRGDAEAQYWTIKKVNNVWVVFLSESLFTGTIDEKMASTAASQLIQINNQ